MEVPRFLLCAGASGSGKTLITCGILQVLKNRGLQVASFKCGPDYIDPMFHSKVLGTKSRNLDTFFTEKRVLQYLLAENCKGMDVAVMEGVMGYYDGAGGITTKASAYELASDTRTPAVLIVNGKGMSLSIVPYIKGFLTYRSPSWICGVILNQMSPMLYPRIRKQIEEELNLPVMGYVPKVEDCVIESRHLGLVLPEEVEGFREKLQKLAGILEETLEVDKLLELAKSAPALAAQVPWEADSDFAFHAEQPVRIGVALDEAFCFVYQDNLELLRKMGAELVPFSPIGDTALPENLDGVILYGGYPELFAQQLEENASMRESIRKAYEAGMPVIAECGGFMYLHDTMEDMKGNPVKGVGIIPGKAYQTPKLGRFGYITLTPKTDRVLGQSLDSSPAHEFHYFDSTSCGTDFMAQKPYSTRGWECIHASDHLLAGFPHFYYYGNPQIPKSIVQCCMNYKKQRKTYTERRKDR